jgi:hypothetical protein
MSRSKRPCSPALGSRVRVMGIDRPQIGFWLGHGVNARLIGHFIRQTLDQLLGRRHLDGRRRDRRLIGVKDDFLRPFALGFDPDGRPFDDVRPIRETRSQLRQRPASYQQKNSKGASDNDKVSGYGQSR